MTEEGQPIPLEAQISELKKKLENPSDVVLDDINNLSLQGIEIIEDKIRGKGDEIKQNKMAFISEAGDFVIIGSTHLLALAAFAEREGLDLVDADSIYDVRDEDFLPPSYVARIHVADLAKKINDITTEDPEQESLKKKKVITFLMHMIYQELANKQFFTASNQRDEIFPKSLGDNLRYKIMSDDLTLQAATAYVTAEGTRRLLDQLSLEARDIDINTLTAKELTMKLNQLERQNNVPENQLTPPSQFVLEKYDDRTMSPDTAVYIPEGILLQQQVDDIITSPEAVNMRAIIDQMRKDYYQDFKITR